MADRLRRAVALLAALLLLSTALLLALHALWGCVGEDCPVCLALCTRLCHTGDHGSAERRRFPGAAGTLCAALLVPAACAARGAETPVRWKVKLSD